MNNSRTAVLAVPPSVCTWTLLSLFISKGTRKEKHLLALVLHMLSGLQEMQVKFLVLSLFCKTLDKISPLKGVPVKQEEGKGWLLSAFVPPFPVFFRITKVFYCPCSQHGPDISPEEQWCEKRWRSQWPGLISQTNALIIKHIVRLVLLALKHLYFWLPNGS